MSKQKKVQSWEMVEETGVMVPANVSDVRVGLSVVAEGRSTVVSLSYETSERAEDIAYALAHNDEIALYPAQVRRATITTKTSIMMRRVIR